MESLYLLISKYCNLYRLNFLLGKNRWDAAGEVDVAALNAKETRLRLYTHTAYDLTKIVSDIASKIQRRGK